MERTGVLIERLLEQYHNQSDNKKLLITVQLLLAELQRTEEEDTQDFSSAVSVFYPVAQPSYSIAEEVEPDVLTEIKDVAKINGGNNIKQPEQHNVFEEHTNSETLFDPMMEIPTLALKQQEVNEAVAAKSESLNEKLKSASSYKEIGHSIKDAPIKDLRKAIGINDRYVFINELFRGDETMYERSIKTINSFNIYGEAELWIKRELKLKLAWNEDSESVQLFDKLVRRRFS